MKNLIKYFIFLVLLSSVNLSNAAEIDSELEISDLEESDYNDNPLKIDGDWEEFRNEVRKEDREEIINAFVKLYSKELYKAAIKEIIKKNSDERNLKIAAGKQRLQLKKAQQQTVKL